MDPQHSTSTQQSTTHNPTTTNNTTNQPNHTSHKRPPPGNENTSSPAQKRQKINPLPEINEAMILLYSQEMSFQSSLQLLHKIHSVAFDANELTGKVQVSPKEVVHLNIRFYEDRVVEVKSNCACDCVLWCPHVCALLLTFIRSPTKVLNFEHFKQDLMNASLEDVRMALISLCKKDSTIMHKFVQEMEQVKKSSKKNVTEQQKNVVNDMEFILPVSSVIPTHYIDWSMFKKNLLQAYQKFEEGEDDEQETDCDGCECSCHYRDRYYHCYWDERSDCECRKLSFTRHDFDPVCEMANQYISIAEDFVANEDIYNALGILEAVGSVIVEFNVEDIEYDEFDETGDTEETAKEKYYEIVEQLSEVLLNIMLTPVCTADDRVKWEIILKSWIENSESDLYEELQPVLDACKNGWDGEELKRVLQGDKEAIAKFSETEQMAELRIEKLKSEKRIKECFNYAEAVKRYDICCDILLQENKVSDTVEFTKKNINNLGSILSLSKRIYNTNIQENKKLAFDLAQFGTVIFTKYKTQPNIIDVEKDDLNNIPTPEDHYRLVEWMCSVCKEMGKVDLVEREIKSGIQQPEQKYTLASKLCSVTGNTEAIERICFSMIKEIPEVFDKAAFFLIKTVSKQQFMKDVVKELKTKNLQLGKNFSILLTCAERLDKEGHSSLAIELALHLFNTKPELESLFKWILVVCIKRAPQKLQQFINTLIQYLASKQQPNQIPAAILDRLCNAVKQITNKFPDEAFMLGEKLLKIQVKRKKPTIPIHHYALSDKLMTECSCNECTEVRKFLKSKTQSRTVLYSVYKPRRIHLQNQLTIRNDVIYNEHGTRVELQKTRKIATPEQVQKAKHAVNVYEDMSETLPLILLKTAFDIDRKINTKASKQTSSTREQQLQTEKKVEKSQKAPQKVTQEKASEKSDPHVSKELQTTFPHVSRIMKIITNLESSVEHQLFQFLIDNKLFDFALEYGQKILAEFQRKDSPLHARADPGDIAIALAKAAVKIGSSTKKIIHFALSGFKFKHTLQNYQYLKKFFLENKLPWDKYKTQILDWLYSQYIDPATKKSVSQTNNNIDRVQQHITIFMSEKMMQKASTLVWNCFPKQNTKTLMLLQYFITSCKKYKVTSEQLETLKQQLFSFFNTQESFSGVFERTLEQLLKFYPTLGIQIAQQRTEMLKRIMQTNNYRRMVEWLRILYRYYYQLGWVSNGNWKKLLVELCQFLKTKRSLVNMIQSDPQIKFHTSPMPSAQATSSGVTKSPKTPQK